MEIKNNEFSINVISESSSIPNNRTPIIFLHGFTGSAEDWSFLFPSLGKSYFPIAIDLPGHGKTKVPNKPNSYTHSAYINTINNVLDFFNIAQTTILGYSMGGRAALAFALNNPTRVKALILESSTAGIQDKKEMAARINTDNLLADKLLKHGINSFIDEWMELPFFSSLKSLDKNVYQQVVINKKRNSEHGLANSLRGFGTGKMPNMWVSLKTISIPTMLIAGELDKKFMRLNKRMNELIKNSNLEIIEKCGHNTHLEKPQDFTMLVNNFLKTLE